jgi:DNA-binding response OmpR family regulator
VSGQTQKRILVVDDERAIRELVRRLLVSAGYECATAGSSADAAELLTRESFDLLLADLQLPGESGLDLVARVRDRHANTAAIVMSGVHDPRLADAAKSLGASGYMVKPFSPEELWATVLEALRRRNVERAEALV